MGLSRNLNIDGRWQKVTLTKEEKEETLERLADENASEFIRCVQKAQLVMQTNAKDETITLKDIVIPLFDKQPTASFTALQDALDEKIEELRKKNKSMIDRAIEGSKE